MRKIDELIYKMKQSELKCPCFLCRAKIWFCKFIERCNNFYRKHTSKWFCAQIWGSDYQDFREYEVLSKLKIRAYDQKGLKWPDTKYSHIKLVDEALMAGAV